ncbi:MAG: FAD-dependent thymidylate synthase [Acidithiobacillus ferriphilus]
MIELLDHMGDDLAVVNAARVSMHKESLTLCDNDEKLIRYLAKHNHWTPFAHVQFQFRIKMPIFVAREWTRSNIGLTRNEVSRRYVDTPPEFWTPKGAWRGRAENVKQGSGDLLQEEVCDDATRLYWEAVAVCSENYRAMLDIGVCPEQARTLLPQSMMTEFIETGSLAAYARIYNLRSDPHAQVEIQDYAHAISEAIAPIVPVSWAALTGS